MDRNNNKTQTQNNTYESAISEWQTCTRRANRYSRRTPAEDLSAFGLKQESVEPAFACVQTLTVENRFSPLKDFKAKSPVEGDLYGPETLEEHMQKLGARPLYFRDEDIPSSVAWWMSSFRMDGYGNMPHCPSEIWGYFPDGCVFCLNPEEELLDSAIVDQYGLPSYEEVLKYSRYRHESFVRWQKQLRDEQRLEDAIEENNNVLREWQRVRDIDRAALAYLGRSCRIATCSRPAVCYSCSGCIKHAKSIACCGEVAKLRQEPEVLCHHGASPVPKKTRYSRLPSGKGSLRAFYRRCYLLSGLEKARRIYERCQAKPAHSGEEQSLFSVGVNLPQQFEHIFRLPAVDDLIQTLKEKGDEVSWATLVREVGFFFYHIRQGGFTKTNILISGAQLVANVGIPMLKEIDWNRFFPNAQESSFDVVPLIGASIAGLLSVLTVVLVKHLPSDKSIDTLLSRMSQIGRVISSLEKIQEYSETISKYCVDFVRTNILGYSSEDLAEWKLIDQFCDEVTSLNTTDFEHKCSMDNGMGTVVSALLQRADSIQKMLDAMRVHPTVYGRFTRCYLFLAKARDICSQVGAGNMLPRVAPLVIHIHGGTGVGKSTMLSYLNANLLTALGSKDPADLQNRVYYRYPTSDFFDGFRNGTDIVVCDDFGSAKDSESHPSTEPLEQIRMTNTAPFRPPMAHLSDKANTVFEAKVVIWTSNRPTFAFPSLTNPEAVHNRVHLRFLQTVHPDFAKTKNIAGKDCTVLDTAKVMKAAIFNPNAWRDCMQFQQQSVEGLPRADGSYETIGGTIGFDEFASICVNSLKCKQGAGKGMLSEERGYFAKLIAGGEAQAVFYRPNRLLKWAGLSTHIDVYRSLSEIAETYKVRSNKAPFKGKVPSYEDLRRLNIPGCVSIPPESEPSFLMGLEEFYDCLVEGSNPDDAMWDLLCYTGVGLCDEHFDHTQCEGFWVQFARCRERYQHMSFEAIMTVKRGYAELPCKVKYILETGATFLVSLLACQILKYGVEWLVETQRNTPVPTKKTRGSVERYENSPRGVPKTNVERYPSGVKAQPSGKVERYPSGVKSQPSGKVEFVQRESPTGVMAGRTESCTDQNAAEVRRKAWHNTYLISYKVNDEKWCNCGTFTFIGGRVGITNRHIMDAISSAEVISLLSADDRCYTIDVKDLVWHFVPDDDIVHGQRDVAVVEMPAHVHLHADIRNMFMTADDFSRHTELDKVSLLGHRIIDRRPRLTLLESNICKAWQHRVFELRGSTGSWYVRDYYTYGIESQPGDCGGILVAFDRRFARKIIGIHMAGVDGNPPYSGCGVAVTRELIDKLVDGLEMRWSHSLINGTIAVDNPINVEVYEGILVHEGPIPGEFIHVGKANTRVYSAKMSAITPSVVAEVCGPIYKKPAFLTRTRNQNGETVDPMAIALKKASTESVSTDPEALYYATHAVDQMINSTIRGDDNKPLTFAEAVCGIPENDLFPSINRSTSPGYGWKKEGKGKTSWLGTDEFRLDDPELLAAYSEAIGKLRAGERIGKYWTDTLKDELRMIPKVEQGKTRLFAAGEMVQTILLRQFFMGFAAHMARNKIEMESCVGVNPYGLDWTRIARKLREVGPWVVAGDFTNYDGTLPADVLWAVFSVVDNFYRQHPDDTEEDSQMRALLWCEIVNSVHINGDNVYMWTHSQPSGCPFTSVLNSVLHSIIVRVVYSLAAAKYAPHLRALSNFDFYVRHINYGDDDVTGISPEIIDWFNQETMAEMYATFGMTYTDELKTGTLTKAKSLEEVRFLKRAFVWDSKQARYRAPLELETIMEMPCWNKTKGDKYALTKMVLEDALYELSQHDKTVWDANYPKFEEARKIINARIPLRFPTWEEMQFEDASKYFGFVKLDLNAVIGVGGQSSHVPPQQILLASDSDPSGLPESGWEGYLPLLASVCPPKSISYSPDVWFSQIELPENTVSTVGIENNQLNNSNNNNNNRKCKLSFWEEGDDILYGEEADATFRGEAQIGNGLLGLAADPAMMGNGATASDSVEETHQLTTFKHDGDIAEAVMPLTRQTMGNQLNASDMLENSVIDFLRRPTQLRSFVWNAGTGMTGNIIGPIQLPREWLAIRMVQEKLQGFRYLRCDLVIEFQINAQPFNAGMCVVWFNPLAPQMTTYPSSVVHLGGITGYPCVYYRCGDSTAVKIRIPFQSNMSHFDLVKGLGVMGDVNCTVMSPLTGASDIDGTIWCWAENISLEMPTGVPLRLPAPVMSGVAQAGVEGDWSTVDVPPPPPPKEDATAPERKMRNGPVEVTMNVLKGLSASVGAVPGLGPIAGVGAALFNFGGKLAGFFGWSKPIMSESPTEVSFLYGKNMTNATGFAHPKVMALDARNVTDIPLEVFGTDEDEMAFQTLLKRETYADSFMFSTTSGQNTLVWKWPVHPASCVKTLRTVSDPPGELLTSQFQNSLLSYLTSTALLWRGGIRYNIRAVKTPFHSGRLRVTFAPGANEQTPLNTIDLQKCYSKVFDLRESSDMIFEVPYVSNNPWRTTRTLSPVLEFTPDQAKALCWSEPTGMLYVTVVNNLRGPSTVAAAIELLVFVGVEKDFQFAIPQPDIDQHVITKNANVGMLAHSGMAQSGLVRTAVDTSTMANETTVGEAFTGFRQWLKRYIAASPFVKVSPEVNLWNFLPQEAINPTATIVDDIGTPMNSWTIAWSLFRYLSGPIRLMIVLKDGSKNMNFVGRSDVAPVAVASEYFPFEAAGNVYTATTSQERIMEYEIPFYQPYPAIPTDVGNPQRACGYVALDGEEAYSRVPYSKGNVLTTDLDPTNYMAYQATGESFSLGFQIGPPMTIVVYGAAAPPP